jgi:GNAT superfamily N-acetyltransferase
MVTIRPAGLDDAAAGAALHIACWREAYASVADPALLARLTDDLGERTERWRSYISAGPPWLAVADDGELVGFAAAGAGRDDDIDLDLELYAIYVRSSQYGAGVGHRLFQATIGEAPAYLWVLEANARAREFYRRQGFEPDGARRIEREFNAPEVRLRRGRASSGG